MILAATPYKGTYKMKLMVKNNKLFPAPENPET